MLFRIKRKKSKKENPEPKQIIQKIANSFDINTFPVDKDSINCFRSFITADAGSILLLQGSGKKSFLQAIFDIENIAQFNHITAHQEDTFPAAFLYDMIKGFPGNIFVITCGDIFFGEQLLSSEYPQIVNVFDEIKRNKKKLIILLDNECNEKLKHRISFYIKIHWTDTDIKKLIQNQLEKKYTSDEISKISTIISSAEVSLNTVSTCLEILLLDESIKNKTKVFETIKTIVSKKKELEQEKSHVPNVYNEKYFNKDFINIAIHGTTNILFDDLVKYLVKTKENFRWLFYGISGTGKTTAAFGLLNACGKKYLYMRHGLLLGSLVGETESNIENMFLKAEKEGLIIIIDEGDSLFLDRNTESVNKRIENSWTNTLISCIDSYAVSIIITTNYQQDIDSAISRRFEKFEFKALSQEKQITALFKTYFPDYNFSSDQISRLSKKTVTPSDFAAVSNEKYFARKRTEEEIFNELINIQNNKLKTRAIGFDI